MFKFIFPTIALAALFSASLGQIDGSWCEIANMTYLQGCCPYIESGPLYPCLSPEFVTNVTECTVDKYPTGWGCCTDEYFPINGILCQPVSPLPVSSQETNSSPSSRWATSQLLSTTKRSTTKKPGIGERGTARVNPWSGMTAKNVKRSNIKEHDMENGNIVSLAG